MDTKPQLHEPGELSSMVSGGAGAHSGHGAHGGHADPGQERPDPPATADTAAASGRDENELSRSQKILKDGRIKNLPRYIPTNPPVPYDLCVNPNFTSIYSGLVPIYHSVLIVSQI